MRSSFCQASSSTRQVGRTSSSGNSRQRWPGGGQQQRQQSAAAPTLKKNPPLVLPLCCSPSVAMPEDHHDRALHPHRATEPRQEVKIDVEYTHGRESGTAQPHAREGAVVPRPAHSPSCLLTSLACLSPRVSAQTPVAPKPTPLPLRLLSLLKLLARWKSRTPLSSPPPSSVRPSLERSAARIVDAGRVASAELWNAARRRYTAKSRRRWTKSPIPAY